MTPRRLSISKLWPWLLIVAILTLGPVLASCAPAQSAATPTPTKTPRPAEGAAPSETPAPTDAPTAAPPPTDPPAASPTTAGPAAATDTPEPQQDSTPSPATAQPAANPGAAGALPEAGVQAFLWWRDDVADRDLGYVKNAGFHWVKQLFSWQDIEGAGKGEYDWSKTDRIVDQAEKYGLKLMVRLSQDPDKPFWAGDPPENAGAYADFVAAVASRYKGRIAGLPDLERAEPRPRVGQEAPRSRGLRPHAEDGVQRGQGHRPRCNCDHCGHGAHRHRHQRSDARHQVL